MISVWPCKSVNLTHVYKNYKINNTCYKYLPVIVEGKIYFSTPGGRDLFLSTPTVDCHHYTTGIFKTEKGWVTNMGPTHVSRVPMDLTWRPKLTVSPFEAPTLFHDRLSFSPVMFNFFNNYVYRAQQLELIVSRLVSHTASSSLEPDTIYPMLSGVGAGVKSSLEGYGNAFSNIIESTEHDAASGLRLLLRCPFQILLNIVIGVLVLVMIGYFTYWSFAYCQFSGFRRFRPSAP